MRTLNLFVAFALVSSRVVAVNFSQSARPEVVRDPQIEQIVAEISPANIEATIRKLVSFKTRHTLSDATSAEQGIGAARNWIKAELERYSHDSGGRLKVEFDAFHQGPTPPRMPQGADIVNVVATLPGTDASVKERVYVVSGHYDSRSLGIMDTNTVAPGANDDASGTAAVIEMARVMSKHSFNATLVFIAVAAEEQSLGGSTHWAEMAKQNGMNVAGMFTNDIVGNTLIEDGTHDRSHVRVFAEGVPPLPTLSPEIITQLKTGGENDFPPRQLARLIAAVGRRYVPQLPVRIVYRRDRYLRGGDHSPFLDRGFAAVRFTEPREAYTRQHEDVGTRDGVKYGDTIEYVDFEYVANVARVNAAALAELSLAPAAPGDVELEAIKLENDSTLRWSAVPGAAGYRIVWRDTTAPEWEHAIDAYNVTRFTVTGISKDNVIFGVESLDAAGHASPAVYPKPRSKP